MKEQLPRSLVEFEAQLEDAVRRELDADTATAGRLVRRAGRLGRARHRVVAATGAAGLSLAGAAAAVALLLGTGATSPAYAVTRNTNGTITFKFLRVSGIDRANIHSLNARLTAMGVKAEVVPGTARVVSAWVHGRAVTCAAMQAVTVRPAEMKHAVTIAVDHSGAISLPASPRQFAAAHKIGVQVPRYKVVHVPPPGSPFAGRGNGGSGSSGSGNSGNSGSGNSGSSSNSGSGSSGNSGSGNSGSGSGPQWQTVPNASQAPVPVASLPPAAIVHARAFAVRCGDLPPGGGNSGNSGSGNSGNSGSGNSGNSGSGTGSSPNSGQG